LPAFALPVLTRAGNFFGAFDEIAT